VIEFKYLISLDGVEMCLVTFRISQLLCQVAAHCEPHFSVAPNSLVRVHVCSVYMNDQYSGVLLYVPDRGYGNLLLGHPSDQ
jgi:hypothetical protein